MNLSYFLILSGASITIASIAALRRHNVFLVMASLNMATSSCVLVIAALSSTHAKGNALFEGIILICFSTLINLLFCGVAILVFRSRGTVRINDLRELRG